MLSGTRANVAIKVFGDDLHELRSIGERVPAAVAGVTGLVDLSVEQQTDIPTVRVQFDRAALRRVGLQAGVAAEALETALVGREVGQILDQQVAVPLLVRYPAADAPISTPSARRRCARPQAAERTALREAFRRYGGDPRRTRHGRGSVENRP